MKLLVMLLTFTMFFTSCFDSGSSDEGGGGLFKNNKQVENLLVLIPMTSKTYVQGENIDITLRHAFDVTVTGTPRIPLDIGGSIVYADYFLGSGSDSLTFRYNVQAGDNDLDNIDFGPNVDLNGGTLQFSNKGVLTNVKLLYATIDEPELNVDTSDPSITVVTPPAATTYFENEQLQFMAIFDETVVVSGTPRIQLDIGGVTRYAEYIFGSNSSTLTFTYTVQSGDLDLDGIAKVSPLDLNGGTILDKSGNTADLTFTPFPMPTTFVQGDVPFVTLATPPSNQTYTAGQSLTLTLNFSKVVNITGTPRVAFDVGGVTKYFEYANGTGSNTINFNYLVFPGDEDLDGISISNTIDLNGGLIQDAILANADLNFTSPLTPNVYIDAGIAVVDSISPPLDKTYIVGEEIFVTLNYDKVVTITGSPQVPLLINSSAPTPVYAEYISGSGSQNINFRYLVKAGDSDPDGIQITNPIDLNGGTIVAGNGLSASVNLSTPLLAINTSNVYIDAAIAAVSSVTAPADNLYVTSNTMDFVVGFSKLVNVTGTPRVRLDIGGATRYADYISGSGSSNLTFRYTVIVSDADNDGILFGSNLIDLNGGTIQDASLANALLDMSAFVPNMSNIFVNTPPLNITSVTPPVNATYLETQSLDFIVNTSDNVNVSGLPRIQIDIGGTTKFATYFAGTGSNALTFRYTVEAALLDLDGILITSPIDLNGGTIQDASLYNLDPSFTLPNTSAVLVDSAVPNIAITTPLDSSYINIANNSATFTVSGTCDENGQTATIEVDAAPAVSPVGFLCDGVNFTGTIDVTGLGEGAHTIVAKIQDVALNEGISSTINITKDTVAPSITGVTPPADNSYMTGNDIDFVVIYDEAVTITNTPRIALDIGGSTVYANYQAGSGTTNITFRYTVLGGDLDNDGITWPSNLIDLNTTGTIQDLASNNGALDMTAFAPTLTNVLVNYVNVNITSVTPPSDATYIETNNIDFIVNTSELVNVTGSPRIQIDIGGTTKYATYNSGTGSTALTFRYVVEDALTDADGISISSPLELNGGTIQNASLFNLALNFTPPAMPAVLVDSLDPTIAITTPADSTYINIASDSATFTVSGTCSENTQVVSIEVNGGAATSPIGFVCDGVNFTGTIDVTGLSEAAHSFTAIISDAATNQTTSAANSVTKDITAPTLTIDPAADATSANYTNYTLSGTCSVSESGQTVNIAFGTVVDTTTCTGAGTWTRSAWNVSAQADNASVLITADLTDLAGNPATQATDNVSKDTSNPTITLTTPANSSYINIANDSATFPVTGTCNDAAATVTIRVNGSPTGSASCDGANVTGSFDSTGLTEAVHNIVLDIDDSVNPVASSSIHSVTRDVTAPQINSHTPPTNTIHTFGANLDFILGFTETITVGGSPRISIDIDGFSRTPSYQTGTGTSSITLRYVVAAEEDYDGLTFDATTVDLNGGSMTDAAGNTIDLNMDALIAIPSLAAVNIDGVIPTVAITSAADITTVNENIYFVTGTCSEDTRTVTVNIDGLSFTPTCTSGTWTTGTIDVSSRADNANLPITADHTDPAGNNATQASTTVDKDTVNPTVTINAVANITLANHTGYTVTGTCSESGVIVDVNIGSINVQPNCTGGGTWSTGSVDVSSLADSGSISITADHSTAPQASTSVSKDTASPIVTISSAPNISLANELSYVASGTCSENGVLVDINIGVLNFQPNCNAGTWTTGLVNVSSLADSGSISFTADHSTAPQASTTIIKNTSTPTVSGLSVPLTYKDSCDLNWNLNDPGGFTIDDYEIQYKVSGTPTWLNYVDDVSTATSGNVDSLSASTNYDFRVRVQYDTSNYSDWSNVASGETKPDDPLFDNPYKAMNVGGATDSNVTAMYDNTRVYINDVEIGASPLTAGQVVNLPSTVQFDVISADKPIYTAGRKGVQGGGNTSKGNIVWNSTAWAGKNFTFNSRRSDPQTLDIYAIEDTYVEVRQGATLLGSVNITAGNGDTISFNQFGSYQVTSTGTVLLYHIAGDSSPIIRDSKPLLPDFTEIIGFPSNQMRMATSTDGTNYNYFFSDSFTGSGSLNKDQDLDIDNRGTASNYAGEAILITADQGISGMSTGDGNGGSAATYLPTNLMKHRYIINHSADWVAFASKQSGTIDVYSPGQTIGVSTPVQTVNLANTGGDPNAPFKYRFGATLEGYRFVSSVPMAGWYQPDSDVGGSDLDETILIGTDDIF